MSRVHQDYCCDSLVGTTDAQIVVPCSVPVLFLFFFNISVSRYCIKAKSRPTVSDNIDMTDFYDDDYDIDDDYDDDDEEDENAEDSEDSGTGKV